MMTWWWHDDGGMLIWWWMAQRYNVYMKEDTMMVVMGRWWRNHGMNGDVMMKWIVKWRWWWWDDGDSDGTLKFWLHDDGCGLMVMVMWMVIHWWQYAWSYGDGVKWWYDDGMVTMASWYHGDMMIPLSYDRVQHGGDHHPWPPSPCADAHRLT